MSKARFRKRFRFYSENTKLLMQLTHHLKTSKVSIYMIIIIYLFFTKLKGNKRIFASFLSLILVTFQSSQNSFI